MVASTAVQIERWPQTVGDFDRLIEATQDELVHFAFYRLGNQADAEDVVQDVYVQAFQQRHKLLRVTEVRGYLFRMVRNRCTDLQRAQRRRQSSWTADAASPDSPSVAMEAQEQAREFARLLHQIPENEADVLRLRAWSELTFPEVAVAVGASVPTVKSRFRYGIEKLRRLLISKGGVQV